MKEIKEPVHRTANWGFELGGLVERLRQAKRDDNSEEADRLYKKCLEFGEEAPAPFELYYRKEIEEIYNNRE